MVPPCEVCSCCFVQSDVVMELFYCGGEIDQSAKKTSGPVVLLYMRRLTYL